MVNQIEVPPKITKIHAIRINVITVLYYDRLLQIHAGQSININQYLQIVKNKVAKYLIRGLIYVYTYIHNCWILDKSTASLSIRHLEFAGLGGHMVKSHYIWLNIIYY